MPLKSGKDRQQHLIFEIWNSTSFKTPVTYITELTVQKNYEQRLSIAVMQLISAVLFSIIFSLFKSDRRC